MRWAGGQKGGGWTRAHQDGVPRGRVGHVLQLAQVLEVAGLADPGAVPRGQQRVARGLGQLPAAQQQRLGLPRHLAGRGRGRGKRVGNQGGHGLRVHVAHVFHVTLDPPHAVRHQVDVVRQPQQHLGDARGWRRLGEGGGGGGGGGGGRGGVRRLRCCMAGRRRWGRNGTVIALNFTLVVELREESLYLGHLVVQAAFVRTAPPSGSSKSGGIQKSSTRLPQLETDCSNWRSIHHSFPFFLIPF